MEIGCGTAIAHSTKFFQECQRTVHPVRKKRLTDAPHPSPGVGGGRGGRALSQALAVGLMRAAYEVLDGMDVVAMEDFQRLFWLLRSDEWGVYRRKNVGVMQGVLTDVRCFDFISVVQFAAITGVRGRHGGGGGGGGRGRGGGGCEGRGVMDEGVLVVVDREGLAREWARGVLHARE